MKPDELKKLMERSGDTPESLAEQIGVSSRTVRRWLKGEWPVPRLAELAMICYFWH